MIKKALLTAASILMSLFFIQALGAPQSPQTMLSYGTIEYTSYFKIGIYTSSWNFGEYDAATIANAFDMSQSWCSPDWSQHPDWDYTAKMNQVHALNPNYKALVYRNVMSIYDYWTDEWNMAYSKGWLLKDINGNYVHEPQWPENYLVDITNPEYQQWIGTKVKSWIDEYPFFDGVMADNSLKYSAQEFDGGGNTRPVNPRTGTYFSDQEILDGCAGVLNAIIDAVGSSKLVLSNGIWSGFVFSDSIAGSNYRYVLSKVPKLSAIGSEGIFYRSYSSEWWTEAQWLQSLNMLVWLQDNFLAGHPEKRFNGWVPVDGQSLPAGTTRQQLMIFGFCSMMLDVKYSEQNTIGFGQGISDYPDLLTLAQRLRGLDMGNPSSDYYKIASTSIYARDFSKGKVFVNPTDASYSVRLDASYTTFDGNVVSDSLTINGHTGIILRK
jgi:hypothetical protein